MNIGHIAALALSAVMMCSSLPYDIGINLPANAEEASFTGVLQSGK